MEDVLSVYQRPLDEKRPLICLDEASKQLLSDARPSLPMATGKPTCQDSEYVRHGTASLFMVSAPLLGWRSVAVTDRRTCQDFAHVIKTLADEQFADADKIVLVMDNLNTHTPASLYRAFAPAEAKRLADKLEVHYTPKHGSWLNMAEIEFSALSRQCLDRRIGTQERLEQEAVVWEANRNAAATKVNWSFTTENARDKLKNRHAELPKINNKTKLSDH